MVWQLNFAQRTSRLGCLSRSGATCLPDKSSQGPWLAFHRKAHPLAFDTGAEDTTTAGAVLVLPSALWDPARRMHPHLAIAMYEQACVQPVSRHYAGLALPR